MIPNITLTNILKKAIDKFYQKDGILLENQIEGMERSCVFRIGIYLQEFMDELSEFDNLKLDCEYNKNKNETKILYGNRVIPDLIIHKRKIETENKMIAEFKGWWNKDYTDDFDKLKKFTLLHGEYAYQLGVFIKLNERDFELKYFTNGQEITEHAL